jgi:hypothetical protein
MALRRGPMPVRYAPFQPIRSQADGGGPIHPYAASSNGSLRFSDQESTNGVRMQDQEQHVAINFRAAPTPQAANLKIEAGEAIFSFNPPDAVPTMNGAGHLFSLGQLNVLLRNTSDDPTRSELFSPLIFGKHDPAFVAAAEIDMRISHNPDYPLADYRAKAEAINRFPKNQPAIAFDAKLVRQYFKFMGISVSVSSIASNTMLTHVRGTRDIVIAMEGIMRHVINVWGKMRPLSMLYFIIGRKKSGPGLPKEPIQVYPVVGTPLIPMTTMDQFDGHTELIFVGRVIEIPLQFIQNEQVVTNNDVVGMRVAGLQVGGDKVGPNFDTVARAVVQQSNQVLAVVIGRPLYPWLVLS